MLISKYFLNFLNYQQNTQDQIIYLTFLNHHNKIYLLNKNKYFNNKIK